MKKEICRVILGEIKKADKIAITRHIRPDGDALGAVFGLASVLKQTFPSKKVITIGSDTSEELEFLGKDDIVPEDISDYLGIVIDTATEDRISEPSILKCRKLIKIDHHIENKPFGDISWVDDKATSASEMIAYFQNCNKRKLKMNLHAATCLYAGIVSDTNRFKYGTNKKTLDLAGTLLTYGVDTQTLYTRLDVKEFSFYKFQSFIFDRIQITPNGVVWLYVDKKVQQDFNLSREMASESVNFMSSIKGALIWMAFIDNPDKDTRVRLRSRFIPINTLAEKYNGGGHAMACGATVHNLQEMQSLISDADALLENFKKNNNNWL